MKFTHTFKPENDIKIISEKNLFKGFFKVNEVTIQHRLFEGGWSDPIRREIFERGDAVAVLPYDPKEDSVVLIEQIRVPAINRGKNPWLIECVAGMVDKDESIEQVARRECMEEAGLHVKTLQLMLSYLSSPGGMSERIHVYYGEVDSTEAMGVHGLDEEGEDIKVHVFKREEAMNMLASGLIDNAATVIALQWLELNRHQL